MIRTAWIVLLAGTLSACGTVPHKIAPVDEWIALQGEDSNAIFSTLESIRPARGVTDAEHSEWMDGLASTFPTTGEWSLHIGLSDTAPLQKAGFSPFLLYGSTPSTVTRVCSQTSSCVSCMHTATRTRGEKPAKPDNTFKGICTTLSTAYSLVYTLGVRTEFGQLGTMNNKNKKKYWKKGFLSQIADDQGLLPDGGTPRDKIKKAYERYGCQCTDERSVADAGSAAAWKRELKDKVEDDPPADCHMIIDGTQNGKAWAHDVHVDGFADGNVAAADTGIQGSGSGEDAPVIGVSGSEQWSVTDSSAGAQVSCAKSPDKDWWNNKNPNKVSYICCTCP